MSEAPVPLPASPSADVDRRTASGERRIELPETALHATRVSERFRVPEEARRSTPPAPSSAPDGTRGDMVQKETRRMPVPESIKRLALPTPPPFGPASIAIPTTTPLPSIAEPTKVTAAGEVPPAPRTRTRREVASAVVLFVLLLVVTAIAVRLVVTLLFA